MRGRLTRTSFRKSKQIVRVTSPCFRNGGSLFSLKSSLFCGLGKLPLSMCDCSKIWPCEWGRWWRFPEFPAKFPVCRVLRAETGSISTASPASRSGLGPEIAEMTEMWSRTASALNLKPHCTSPSSPRAEVLLRTTTVCLRRKMLADLDGHAANAFELDVHDVAADHTLEANRRAHQHARAARLQCTNPRDALEQQCGGNGSRRPGRIENRRHHSCLESR
jgi:hypothetical protein